MKFPSAGDLRSELRVEEQVRVPAAGGGADLGWHTVGLAWADIRPRAGREEVVDGQRVARISHEVWIRERAGTIAGMRLLGDAGTFEILAVLPAGSRSQWMRCLCRQTV